jgi:hypothetical protein
MRSRAMRLGIAAAVAIAATVALYAQTTMQRGAYIEELDARAEQLRPIARTLLTKRQQLRMIEERVDRSRNGCNSSCSIRVPSRSRTRR